MESIQIPVIVTQPNMKVLSIFQKMMQLRHRIVLAHPEKIKEVVYVRKNSNHMKPPKLQTHWK